MGLTPDYHIQVASWKRQVGTAICRMPHSLPVLATYFRCVGIAAACPTQLVAWLL